MSIYYFFWDACSQDELPQLFVYLLFSLLPQLLAEFNLQCCFSDFFLGMYAFVCFTNALHMWIVSYFLLGLWQKLSWDFQLYFHGVVLPYHQPQMLLALSLFLAVSGGFLLYFLCMLFYELLRSLIWCLSLILKVSHSLLLKIFQVSSLFFSHIPIYIYFFWCMNPYFFDILFVIIIIFSLLLS